MKCTGNEWDTCRVEKMKCTGCYYTDEIYNKYHKEKEQTMKIKNVNLQWNVIYHDSDNIKQLNILGYSFPENLAKAIKKYKINNREQLKKYLRKDFMYHYWSKSEYEIAVGGLSSKYPEEFEKIDIWYQIEMNFDNIVDYIIQEMRLFQNL